MDVSERANKKVASELAWIAGLILVAAVMGMWDSNRWAASPLSVSSTRILQPEVLSLLEDTPVDVQVVSKRDARTWATVSLASSDGGVTVPVSDAEVTLHPGVNVLRFLVAPSMLSPFSPGEDVTIRATVGGRATFAPATAQYASSSSDHGDWELSFGSSPVVISVRQDNVIQMTVTNPKERRKTARIQIQFLDADGRSIASIRSNKLRLYPGQSTQTLVVPTGTAQLAQSGGAKHAMASLRMGGGEGASGEEHRTRASATAPVVFDVTSLSASSSADLASGPAPLSVTFTGAASGGSPPYTYDWDFGDGSPHGASQGPNHLYTSAGTYSAALEVRDGAGAQAEAPRITITVTAGGGTLSASASGSPTSGAAPLTVNFTGGASGGASPYTYDWNFGDGSAHGTAQSPSHVYGTAGSYSATLTVHDSASGTATSGAVSITVTVTPPSLSATASGSPTSGTAPLTVNFTGGASGGTAPYTYDWNFGDGSAHGPAQNPSHVYSAAGTFSAVLMVHDSASGTATSAAVTITVTVTPPSLSATASGSPTSGTAPLTVNFTGGASGGTAPYTYDWNFGDGSAHGPAQNPSHVYSAAGTFSAVLMVHDSASGTATSAAVTITVASGGGTATLSSIQARLFTPSCTGCHGGGSPTAGMNLEAGKAYSNLVNVVSTTNAPMLRVKPNDTANSFLVVQLASGHRSVSAADQQAIKDWINAGALNN